MARLIDANKIYDAVERRYQISSGIEHRCERDLLDLICNAPTVDAVEVVRCKDCKYWQPVHGHIPRMECQIFSNAHGNGYVTRAYVFCFYGERRTDD